MTVRPDGVWLNMENLVSSSSFALLTGMENWSQSPAGDTLEASMPFSVSQVLTAATVSGFGVTSASTWVKEVSDHARHSDVPKHTSSLLRCWPYRGLPGVLTSISACSSAGKLPCTRARRRLSTVSGGARPISKKEDGMTSRAS